MNAETMAMGIGGFLVVVVALVIVKKFGRLISTVLTLIGGLVVIGVVVLVYQVIAGALDDSVLLPWLMEVWK